MNFDWLLFDADHTLFDFDRSAREALSETMERHGISYREGHWKAYSVINKQCWTAYENGEIDRETMRTRRFSMFFEQIGAGVQDLEAFATQYLHAIPKRPYFIDGAAELLSRLHGRFRMGIVTNGLTEVQRPRLVSTGIDRFFEVIVVSGEIGLMKPDYAYFEYVHIQMSRPDKQKVLVIGDSLNADIRGGAEFGFMTCWYNPGVTKNEATIIPDYEIDNLRQIPKIVGM